MSWVFADWTKCLTKATWNQKEHAGKENGTSYAWGCIIGRHWAGFLEARWCHS